MTEPNIAFVANLLADPSRAAMCLSLAGGEARPAGELAARAGISAQTASNHLAKLIAGRLLRVEQQGRWRYYRLAGADVGHAVEALFAQRWIEDDGHRYHVTPTGARSLRAVGIDVTLRRAQVPARRCLDWTERRPHVAGPVGTALAEVALDRGWVRRLRGTRAVAVTPLGRAQLNKVFNVRWEERP